jgi:alanine-synthesizing transaminase
VPLLSDWSTPHPSDLSLATTQRREAGLPIVDLVTANPHEHGIVCDPALVERAMLGGLRDTTVYRPDARGRLAAREAVARWHGGACTAGQVILTPGTSMAYYYAFRLLAERGEVLCPTPTYPLFSDLARVAGCGVRRYHLAHDGNRWSIDPDEVAFQITPATRVLVLVSPHNPTGHVVSAHEMNALCAIARKHDLAIVFDEVFRDVLHAVDDVPRPSKHDPPLTITMNGLSKRLALPGLKAGWMVVEGDPKRRDGLLNALEYLSDTFLPVNDAVQGALPMLMSDGEAEVQRLAAIYRVRMREFLAEASDAGMKIPEPDGGIYALLRTNDSWHGREEELAIRLVELHGVLLHPGGLYGLDAGWMVATTVHAHGAREIARVAAELQRRGDGSRA